MEGSVWNALFAQAATFVSHLYASLKKQSGENNGGALPSAPASDVDSTLTSLSVTTLVVTRDPKMGTAEGVFGRMYCNGKFLCFTLENAVHLVAPGTYTAQLDMSPHLGYMCPHLRVPDRDALAGGDAGIRLHIANYPTQLEGCIAVGQSIGEGCLEHSQVAFYQMMPLLPLKFIVSIGTL